MNALERKGMMATILETDVLYPPYNPSNLYENEDFKDFGYCRCNMMNCWWEWNQNKLNSLSDEELSEVYEKIILLSKC